MRMALVVRGGWDGHQPIETSELFIPFLRQHGFDVQIRDTLDAYLDLDLLARACLIVPCWTTWMVEPLSDRVKNLMDAVKAGAGIAGWHGGMCDSFRGELYYQYMTGGQFVAHPNSPLDFDVRIADPRDPIMKGLGGFRMRQTEQYYMMVDPGVKVLADTTFIAEPEAGTVMPVVWTKPWGAGRVFYNALGHSTRDFEIPEARTIMERGLLWAAAASRAAVPAAASAKA